MRVYTELLTFSTNPVQITNSAASPGAQTSLFPLCARLYIEPLASNGNIMYVGITGMSVSTGAGVIAEIPKPAQTQQGVPSCFEVVSRDGSNKIDLLQYFFQGTSGQKVKVSWWVA